MPEPTENQTLQHGQVFLHFQIEKRLGIGGMGEVYLASDAQLGRKVALKILPTEKMSSPESVLRFEQEARAASSLSHPNIAHIYEIGESDGLRFIAMEYIEGESLAKKIGGRPLSTAEAVKIAIDIADALDEAHEQGVIHRDIKSDNVMIDKRGRVKVLDFGLAKVAHAINSEDATALKTRSGVVMGTASYMSPEQALGRETDTRTDLWSLGVVLYEMTTGRLPFVGESITDTIDKITHKQPDAIARFNYDVPAEFEVIIRKALRKSPDERYQSARDILIDLRSFSKELEIAEQSTPAIRLSVSDSQLINSDSGFDTNENATQTLVQDHTTNDASSPSVRTISSAEYIVSEIKRHKLVTAAAIAIVAVLVAGGLGIYKYRTAGKVITQSNDLRFVRLTNGGKVDNEDIIGNANISPDGKRVAFWTSASGKLSCWVRQVSANSTVKIFGPVEQDSAGTTFSPDSDFVYFSLFEEHGPVLYQIPVVGGTPRRILDGVASPITFSPDGKQIAYVTDIPGRNELKVANSDGSGTPRTLAVLEKPEFLVLDGPSWSPDGKVIAVGAVLNSGSTLDGEIMIVPSDSGAAQHLAVTKWVYFGRVAWLKDGTGLVTDQFLNPLSVGTQVLLVSYPEGNARRITHDLNGYGTVSLGVTDDTNTIATVQEDFSHPIYSIEPNQDASRAKQLSNGKYDGGACLKTTVDGKVIYCVPSGDANDIWLMNHDGGANKQLTNDQFSKSHATVSADGRRIVFASDRGGSVNIWSCDINGNDPRQVTTGGVWDAHPTLSPDGKRVVFNSQRSRGKNCLWTVPIDGGTPTQLTDQFSWNPVFSPDGKFIATFFVDAQSQTRLGILPINGGDFEKTFDLPGVNSDAGLEWAPDGQSITYVKATYGSNIVNQPISGGPPKALTNFKVDRIFRFAWTADGKQLIYARGPFVDDIVLLKDFR
jgi:serine/threonine protein kinase/Tol biopolymer transport system component